MFACLAAITFGLTWASTAHVQGVVDPLPGWNDGRAKRAIIAFVTAATDETNVGFIPVAERSAAFDNDGTLWSEKPLPVEVYFSLARVRELAASDPSLAARQPFKAALEGDGHYFHEAGPSAIAELIATTHTGMSQEQFAETVDRFLATAEHPALERPFTALTYRPMVQLIEYLRANGFEIWISSGGTIDFIRAFGPRVYGVPPERTIGTEFERESRRVDGRLEIHRLPTLEHLNDKDGKPVGIDRHLGRRPALVAGNVLSGGDVAMMEYSKGRRGPSLQLLVNHDDPAREFAYAEKDSASLSAAHRMGFVVVSIKDDWREVFAPQ